MHSACPFSLGLCTQVKRKQQPPEEDGDEDGTVRFTRAVLRAAEKQLRTECAAHACQCSADSTYMATILPPESKSHGLSEAQAHVLTATGFSIQPHGEGDSTPKIMLDTVVGRSVCVVCVFVCLGLTVLLLCFQDVIFSAFLREECVRLVGAVFPLYVAAYEQDFNTLLSSAASSNMKIAACVVGSCVVSVFIVRPVLREERYRFLEIKLAATAPGFRGQGHGRSVWARVRKWAIELRCSFAVTYADRSTGCIDRFWRPLGFLPVLKHHLPSKYNFTWSPPEATVDVEWQSQSSLMATSLRD